MTTDLPAGHTSFRLARRGYEPIEVDQRIAELMKQSGAQQQRIVELTTRIRELETSQALASEQLSTPAGPPSFADLGARVGQILSLAEEEAAEIRSSAKTDFEDRLREAESSAESVRSEAEAYAQQRRLEADEEAKALVANAHRRADELLEETKRDAEARRAEADALYEAQQAKAAQAAADFETTLAERRDRVEAEFASQFATARTQLDEAQTHLDQTRTEAQRIRTDAEVGSRRLLEDARQEATEVVAQARAHADRIAAESDRALAAATQRRDSINAQLANVRQMLATLTNVSPASLLALDDDDTALPGEAAPTTATAPPEATDGAGPELSDETRDEVGAEVGAEVAEPVQTADADTAEPDAASDESGQA